MELADWSACPDVPVDPYVLLPVLDWPDWLPLIDDSPLMELPVPVVPVEPLTAEPVVPDVPIEPCEPYCELLPYWSLELP